MLKILMKKNLRWGSHCVIGCGEQITGTVEVKSTKSNDFNILLIKGSLQGDNLPKTIGVKISTYDHIQWIVITTDVEL